MRSLHKLYKLVLKDYIKQSGYRHKQDITLSLCFAIFNTPTLTESEKYCLARNLRKNKPSETKHQEFFDHPLYLGGIYWWHAFEWNTRRERVKFLQLMVEIHKPWYIKKYEKLIKNTQNALITQTL